MVSTKDALILAQQRELDYLHTFLEAHLPRLEIIEDGSLMTLYSSWYNKPCKLEMQRDRWRFTSDFNDGEWSIGDKVKNDIWPHYFSIVFKLSNKEAEVELRMCRESCAIYVGSPIIRWAMFDSQRNNPLFLERVRVLQQTLQAQFERWYPTKDPAAHD